MVVTPVMRLVLAVVLSLVLHVGLIERWSAVVLRPVRCLPKSAQPLRVGFMVRPLPEKKPVLKSRRPKDSQPRHQESRQVEPPATAKLPATKAAPPAPSAEEWQVAATYTLKNSKRYRYDWGQQVRSMMGTAVEGPQAGLVRFHIEIAPDGKVAQVVELWATSKVAEKLAWKAIRSLPTLPPTPTGKPLIFEETIAFEPFDSGWPPNYKLDYLPDTPPFHNPFAQNAANVAVQQPATMKPEQPVSAVPHASPDGPAQDIDAEDADMQRQIDVWGRGQMNGVK